MTLVPVDTSNAVEVTDYLTKARDWLSSAVEKSTPIGIAGAKVEIAVAAEATKQLGLSKEIQDEAAEMVRRAEYTLRKATKKAQAVGELRSREDNLTPGQGNPLRSAPNNASKASPKDFFAGSSEYRDALVMGELSEPQFEAVLAEAKAEGNLSRANVVRKATEATAASSTPSTPAPKSTPRRRPLPDQFFDAVFDAGKAIERLARLADDDRLPQNAELVAARHGNDLSRSKDLLEQVIAKINYQERTP